MGLELIIRLIRKTKQIKKNKKRKAKGWPQPSNKNGLITLINKRKMIKTYMKIGRC